MIIVRYLIRETIKSQFAIMLVLFLVFFSQKFIRILANATEGSIPASEVLTLVGLYLPYTVMLMLPLSLYLGILITFGRLYAESEITVMNATGIGNKFLIKAALSLALITSCIAAVNALWVTPWAAQQELKVMESLEADSGLELLAKGKIQSTPNGQAVVFIDDITSKGRNLERVFIAQPVTVGNLRPSVIVAKSGKISQLPDGRQVLELNEGMRYEGTPAQQDYTNTQYASYQVLIGQREVKQKQLEWDAMPTLRLMKADSLPAIAEFQWRISLILCVPLMTMIVIPLSAVNPRQGRFAKLLPAILIYLTYFLALSASRSALEEGIISPYIGLWGINFAAFILACGLLSWDSLPLRKLKARLRSR